MLFQTCTKLKFGLSDVFVVTVIARNWINGVGSLFYCDRILRFGENMPQSLKRLRKKGQKIVTKADCFLTTIYTSSEKKKAANLWSYKINVLY